MADIIEYKCPCCGGAIAFDANSQMLKCPYCDTKFDPEEFKKDKEAFDNADASGKDAEVGANGDDGADDDGIEYDGQSWQEGENGVRVYVCASCGGSIIGDDVTAATSCPYCGNPVIMTGNVAGSLKPDAVIPFKLDKEAAKAGLRKHMKGKKLLPKVFKDENHIDTIKGIYVPFWLFDSDVNAHIRFHATTTRHWRRGDYEYTETSHYGVTRGGTIGFDRVPVDGSSKMPDDLTESLEPFDYSQAVDFQTAYLAGYFADKYDVSAQESEQRAKSRIRTGTTDAFSSTVCGYGSVSIESSKIALLNGKVRYALYPVWLLHTSWRGNDYLFAMNGQTGKFVGNLPMDKGLYWKWLLGLTAGISAVIFLLIALFSYL